MAFYAGLDQPTCSPVPSFEEWAASPENAHLIGETTKVTTYNYGRYISKISEQNSRAIKSFHGKILGLFQHRGMYQYLEFPLNKHASSVAMKSSATRVDCEKLTKHELFGSEWRLPPHVDHQFESVKSGSLYVFATAFVGRLLHGSAPEDDNSAGYVIVSIQGQIPQFEEVDILKGTGTLKVEMDINERMHVRPELIGEFMLFTPVLLFCTKTVKGDEAQFEIEKAYCPSLNCIMGPISDNQAANKLSTMFCHFMREQVECNGVKIPLNPMLSEDARMRWQTAFCEGCLTSTRVEGRREVKVGCANVHDVVAFGFMILCAREHQARDPSLTTPYASPVHMCVENDALRNDWCEIFNYAQRGELGADLTILHAVTLMCLVAARLLDLIRLQQRKWDAILEVSGPTPKWVYDKDECDLDLWGKKKDTRVYGRKYRERGSAVGSAVCVYDSEPATEEPDVSRVRLHSTVSSTSLENATEEGSDARRSASGGGTSPSAGDGVSCEKANSV
jgi:hypothetical protein